MSLRPLYLPEESKLVDTRPLLFEILQKHESVLYTEKQAQIFSIARKALNRAELGLGPLGYSVIILIPAVLTLFSSKAIHSNTTNILVATFAALLISNIASMVLTGSLPHKASKIQNQEQEVLNDLKVRFDNLGKYLVREYIEYSPEERRCLQKSVSILISLLEIKKYNLREVTTQTAELSGTLKFFEDSLCYIVAAHTNYNTELEGWIAHCNLCKQLALLSLETSLV
ncbi:MAG: hypothetical protein FJZ63_03170 [Chlamydiae bacterium]|nr:hypothetical protein [Chlamydiota bacterium]